MNLRLAAVGLLLLLPVGWALPARAAAVSPADLAADTGCVACHASLPRPASARPAAEFRQHDVHRASGLTCVECHGGDPQATDRAAAHDPAKGYRGTPSRGAITEVCARCHSDAAFMHRYAPRQRVDQASEYATSVHAKRLAAGDARVATCVSCHGAHGIRAATDVRSPVFRTNIAKTCAGCHADAERMKGYTRRDGTPLPTNQWADYERSAHYASMTKGNNLSSATCSDCHGSHGAAPPGVDSIVNVCGTCHAVFAAKFDTSPHRRTLTRGCVDCHGNHAVLAPDDERLGLSEPPLDAEGVQLAPADAICGTCHHDGDRGSVVAGRLRASVDSLRTAIERSSALTDRLRKADIDAAAPEAALQEARTRLMLARLEVHAVDPATVEPVIRDGLEIVARADRDGERAWTRHVRRFRLMIALSVAISVLVLFGLGMIWRDHVLDIPPRPPR